MMQNKRKTVRSTATQINILINYMVANPLFAAGEFSGPLGAQKLEAEWSALADTLKNHGPAKTVNQWKHTWRDLKKRAREEGGKVRLARSATGNTVPIPELSEQSQKILDAIGHESATGIASEAETGLGDDSTIFVQDVENEDPQSQTLAQSPTTFRGQASGVKKQNLKYRSRVGTTSNAVIFIKEQKKTNQLLEELSSELKRSNELRTQQLCILQAIAEKLERSAPP